MAARPVLPLPLPVLDELGAVEGALLDHHDAHVAHSDVGRRQLMRELALEHLRLAQLPGLIRTCQSKSDDQYPLERQKSQENIPVNVHYQIKPFQVDRGGQDSVINLVQWNNKCLANKNIKPEMPLPLQQMGRNRISVFPYLS